MALMFDYFDPQQHTVFKDAYIRIISGSFDSVKMDIFVGVYASKSAREAEKNRELLSVAVQKATDDLTIAQNNRRSAETDLLAVVNAMEKAEHEFSEGRINQKQLDQAKGAYAGQKEKVADLSKVYADKLAVDQQLRAQLTNLPVVKLLDVKKFSFPMTYDTIESGGVFSYLYNMLKTVNDFEGAENAVEV